MMRGPAPRWRSGHAAAVLAPQTSGAQRPLDDLLERLDAERLEQEIVRPGLQAAMATSTVPWAVMTTRVHSGRISRAARQRDAVHAAQAHVEQGEVGCERARDRQGRFRGRHRLDAEAQPPERFFEETAHQLVVIDDEHALASPATSRSSSSINAEVPIASSHSHPPAGHRVTGSVSTKVVHPPALRAVIRRRGAGDAPGERQPEAGAAALPVRNGSKISRKRSGASGCRCAHQDAHVPASRVRARSARCSSTAPDPWGRRPRRH